jgi:LacI family transcriptional regulator
MQNIALLSSVDNLSVGKLRVEGYLKALDNNIPINEDIILRTDSEEDLNKIEAIFDNNTIDGVLL